MRGSTGAKKTTQKSIWVKRGEDLLLCLIMDRWLEMSTWPFSGSLAITLDPLFPCSLVRNLGGLFKPTVHLQRAVRGNSQSVFLLGGPT